MAIATAFKIALLEGLEVVFIVIGVAASLLMRRVDDPMIEITLTTVVAYGSFATAETLHSSGVIATVAAGMLCGHSGARRGAMSPSTRIALRPVSG